MSSVNVICPGAIKTEIDENTGKRDLENVRAPVEFPEGKVPLTHGGPGTAEPVAQLVLFLASGASSHISGTEVWIDGAQSLLQGRGNNPEADVVMRFIEDFTPPSKGRYVARPAPADE